MTLHRAGHTTTITADPVEHTATCTCGWHTTGDRLDVDTAAWQHLRAA